MEAKPLTTRFPPSAALVLPASLCNTFSSIPPRMLPPKEVFLNSPGRRCPFLGAQGAPFVPLNHQCSQCVTVPSSRSRPVSWPRVLLRLPGEPWLAAEPREIFVE